jgi:hypothetical protein
MNPIVAAGISVRLMVFAEARFQWQRIENSRPGTVARTTPSTRCI